MVLKNNAKGKSISSVLGSFGIDFDLDRGRNYVSYGYPSNDDFDGYDLYECTAKAADDQIYLNTSLQGSACQMAIGASGGPWISNGRINSVNSFTYPHAPGVMYVPYFGSTVQSAYNVAQTY